MADQKRTGLDWEDIRVFLALGRHGSLSAAARVLGVNHATVARRLKGLEAALGAKLVDRRPDGYVLTPEGTRALAAAGAMDNAAGTLGRDDGADGPLGLVRINASPALAQGFLVARLAPLPAAFPGLDIDLATDLRAVSLERHETDIAIRLGRPAGGDLLARTVARIGYGYYGGAAWAQRQAAGTPPVFVGFDEVNLDLPEAVWLARHFPQARVAFRTSSQFAQATAAAQGAGLALLPHYLAAAEPELVLCAVGPVPPPREVVLLIRRSDRDARAIRTVADAVADIFRRNGGLFDRGA